MARGGGMSCWGRTRAIHREAFPAVRFAICGASHLHLLYEFASLRLWFCYLRDNEHLAAAAYELGTHATIPT